nr:MAG TPA: hypothetical protein [Caudoviricetes sp.]
MHTATYVDSGSKRTFTVATAPGPSPVAGFRATLSDMQWCDG